MRPNEQNEQGPDTGRAKQVDLGVEVVGLGGWGTRAAERCSGRGLAARAVDTDPRVARSSLDASRRHLVRAEGATLGDLGAAARAIAEDPSLEAAIADGGDRHLFVVVAHLGSSAGALVPALLERLEELAPGVGRLAVLRLPSLQTSPDERALGLVALNGVLAAPPTGILVAQPSEGVGFRADAEAASALDRIVELLSVPGGGAGEPIVGLSRASLVRHLSVPGFVGWRELGLTRESLTEDGWLAAMTERPVGWQPTGFRWGDAQSILALVRAPKSWLEAEGQPAFDRLVREAWDEAAPCATAHGLLAGEPAVAVVVAAGLPFPTSVLELRDSVESDRERLAEKRRAAATLIPLDEDFLATGTPLPGEPIAAMGEADRTEASPPSAEPELATEPVVAEPEPAEPVVAEPKPAEPELATEPAEPQLAAEPDGEPPTAVAEPTAAEAAPVRREGAAEPEADRAPEASEPQVSDRDAARGVETGPSAQPSSPEAAVATEVATAEAEAEPEAEPEAGVATQVEPAPAEAEPEVEPVGRERERAEPTAAMSPYETALALACRILNADDLGSDVDLGEIRYALYDLLEVLRDEPRPLLTEVFRPIEQEYFERHHVNVAVLSLLTGDLLGATLSDIIDLGTAAMLHDIGMIETRSTWDVEVRLPPRAFDEAIRQHPERGFERLQEITGMTGDIARMVVEEHERMDGTGYPEGITGEAIDPGARVLAVCDTLEALTHPRPFRERLSPGEALSRLQILGQYTLDAQIVETLTEALGRLLPSDDAVRD